jgi:capsular exopolysaccharide synthesis family protein
MASEDPVPQSVPPGLAASLNGRALVSALRRRWLTACVCSVLATFGAAGATWLFLPTPKHTAQTLLHVEAHPPSVVYQRGETKADFQSYQRTQIALVKSRFVLNAALRDPEVASLGLVRDPIDPIGWLQRELLIDFSIAPEILRIALTGDQPEEAKVLVAKITKAYLDEIVKREDGKKRDRQEKLKEIHERYQENLRTKRRTLRELIENVGSGDPATIALKQRFSQEQLALTEKELLQLDSELRKLQTELSLAKTKETSKADWKVPDADLDDLVQKDLGMQKLAARKSKLEQDISDALRVAVRGENEPRVQSLRKELAALETTIKERRAELRPKLTEQALSRVHDQMHNNRTAMAERVQSLAELRKVLVKDIDRLASESRTLNKGSLDIESYRQDIAQTEETGRKVSAELEALTVELKAVPRITELESAFVTQPDDYKRRGWATAAAAALGLLLALLAVGWREIRLGRVQSPDELAQGLGIKLLGTVPPLPKLGSEGEVAPSAAEIHLLPDALDATRAMLLHAARAHAARVVMITSAVAGEGKTTLAGRLAASLARTGRKTLLIDADLRNPGLHRLFKLPNAPGLSDALLATAPVEEAIRETAFTGLSMLSAGRPDNAIAPAIALENLGIVLKELRDQYDLVLIDSPPVLAVADPLLIGQQVDGAILSTLHDFSQLPKVHAAYERLTQLEIRVFGAVLNGTDAGLAEPDYPYASSRSPFETPLSACGRGAGGEG